MIAFAVSVLVQFNGDLLFASVEFYGRGVVVEFDGMHN